LVNVDTGMAPAQARHFDSPGGSGAGWNKLHFAASNGVDTAGATDAELTLFFGVQI
jgi:hypothetical protein